MKEFTNFSKKALATANVITVEQFLFISDVIHNSEGGFYSAALHKGKRYMAITLYGDKCNPRYTYYVVDLINMTAEQVDSIQQAKQMISEIVSKGGKKATDMSTNSAVSIPRPSCDEVDKYLHKWNTTPDLYEPDAVLNELFTKTLPYNRSIDDIILKVATLNTIYNTRITSIYPIAQHILSLGIDARLRADDETLVQELMSVDYAGTGDHIDHYSFASKYCSFHNPDSFPIYDSYVDAILWYYQSTENFYTFKRNELKNYSVFKCIIREFQHHFGLDRYTTKQLDQYLWQFGKEYFSDKKGKS
jgi:hypothetical protein